MMSTNLNAKSTDAGKQLFTTKDLTIVGMMIALTIVMLMTPLGMITLPMVRITISHVPILLTAILFGLPQGFVVALAFGVTSLLIALTSPVSVLDPFFVNPLISILPRVMIPVTTYFTYHGLNKLLGNSGAGQTTTIAISLAVGNLTNTFGVYGMLYLVYAKEILEKTGTPALSLILGLMSTTTAIKCAGIVMIGTPLVLALKRALRYV